MRYLSPGQWQEWERTGKKPQNIASTCYFCYLWLVHFIVDENIRLGNRSCPVYPMFYNPVEVPGGYNRRAIRSTVEGYTNGLTRPLRFFTPNQLVPCMRRVRKQVTDPLSGQTRLEEVEVRGYREDDSLLFLDGGQPKNTILAHQPVQPPSYTVTSFTTPPLGAVSILRDELMDPARLKQHDPRIDLRPPLTPAAAKVASETAARYPDADILHSLRLQQLSLQEALRMRVGDTLSGKV